MARSREDSVNRRRPYAVGGDIRHSYRDCANLSYKTGPPCATVLSILDLSDPLDHHPPYKMSGRLASGECVCYISAFAVLVRGSLVQQPKWWRLLGAGYVALAIEI
jgi:hypothetical protein